MNAIIMAGGEGTRLKSVTGDLPKPMARLCGKPILEHILLLLRRNGIRDVCITLRYRPEEIQGYFGDGSRWGMHIRYCVETEPLGTAGGVRACKEFYGDRDFLVISGDCACDFDLSPLLEAHRRHRPAVTMGLYAHPRPLQYGIVLTDRLHRVVSFVEKPDWSRVISDLVNTGIYVLSPAAMEFVSENRPCDFGKELFPRLLDTGHEILGIPLEGYWCDLGTPENYHQCNLDGLRGVLRLEGVSAPAPLHPAYTQRPDAGTTLIYRCRSRARLMRLLSEELMEAGADFTDGLTLKQDGGVIKITPEEGSEAVRITAAAENPAAAAPLAMKYSALAKKLDSAAAKEKD